MTNSRPGTLRPVIRSEMNTALDGILTDLPDMSDGNCYGSPDPDIWFPEGADAAKTEELAKRICGSCAIRLRCLDWAIDNIDNPDAQIRNGIWGGFKFDGYSRIDDLRNAALNFRAKLAREIELADLLAENRRASREAWDEIKRS